MPCPDLGALRASIDDAPGTAPALDDHLRACPSCAGTLAELQRNAELAAPAIALTAPDDPPAAAAAEAALARLEQRRARLAHAQTATAPPPPRPPRCPRRPPPARRRPGWGPGPAGWRRRWSRPWC